MENLEIKNLEALNPHEYIQIEGGVKGPDGCIIDPFKDLLDSLGKRSTVEMINI